MPKRLPRWVILPSAATAVLGALCFVFGFQRSEYRKCSRCWAQVCSDEIGLAFTQDARWTLHRSVVAGEALAGVARFLPPGHVHDQDAVGSAWRLWCRPYRLREKFGHRPARPSEFAMALCEDAGFGTFVASQIKRGTTDLQTVQDLIAVPNPGWRDAAWCDAHLDLLRMGAELRAAFVGEDPRRSKFWSGVDPYDRDPPR